MRFTRDIKEIVRSPSFGSLLAFAGSGVFVSIIGGVGGLLQARWVPPEVFGEIQQYAIITGYLTICSQLVNDGFIRQFPYFIGKGRRDLAIEVAGVAKWWYLLVTYLASAFFLCLAIMAAFRGDWRAVLGWLVQVSAVTLAFYGGYLGILYRTNNDFKRLSLNNVLAAWWNFGLLVLVRFFGYYGIAFRYILNNGFSVWVNRKYAPVKIRPIRDFKKLASLASISLKFSIPAYMHANGLSATRGALLLYFCAKSGLGIYSMAVAFKLLAMSICNSLNQIFNVKIISKFGATEDLWLCFRYSLKPAALALIPALIVCCGGGLFLPTFIEYVVPKYIPAIPVVNILLFSVLIFPLGLPLLVIKAALMWKTAAAQAIANFIVTVGMILALPKEPRMFALATVVGEFSESIVGYGLLWFIYRKQRRLGV